MAGAGPPDSSSSDVLRVATTPWHDGGLYFDCKEKVNLGVEMCAKSCFGPLPDFSAFPYLTFRAKYSSNGAEGCVNPTLRISKRWPGCGSKIIELAGSYVQGGSLVDYEFRTVVVPTSDLLDHDAECENGMPWALNDVRGLWFRTCGASAVHDVADIRLVDEAPTLEAAPPSSEAPTGSPTAFRSSVIFGSVEDAVAHDTEYALTEVEGYVAGKDDAFM